MPGSSPGAGADRALAWSLAWRYLRGSRSSLLAGSARAALASTGLGVMAMVIAMALMSGYTAELASKILGSGAIIAYPQATAGAAAPGAELTARIAAVDGVSSVLAVAFAQGSVSSERYPPGLDVTLRGVDPGTPVVGGNLVQLGSEPLELPVAEEGVASALLGADLAAKLGATEGERLRLVVVTQGGRGPRFRYLTVRHAGSFSTGFAEYDRHWVVVDRSLVRRLAGTQGLFEIGVEKGGDPGEIRRRVEKVLGDEFLVTDWEPYNRELFAALRLQKLLLFLVLGLIVVVSTFNVASTLIVLVRERMREVGLLGALGLRPRQLVGVFVLCGGTLGAAGTLLGLGLGSAVSWVLTTFHVIRFDAEVAAIYFISSVPFRLRPVDLLAVSAFSVGVTFLACWLPARRVARVEPAVALRYE